MRDTNITMTKGDTLAFGFEYDGTEQDLDTAIFAIKTVDGSGGFLAISTLGDGIEKKATGAYIVRLAPEKTAGESTGHYPYAFQVGLNDDVFTILQGTITLEADNARL